MRSLHALIEAVATVFCAVWIAISLPQHPERRHVRWAIRLGSILHVAHLAAYVALCFVEKHARVGQLLLGLSTIFHPQSEILNLGLITGSSNLRGSLYLRVRWGIWALGGLRGLVCRLSPENSALQPAIRIFRRDRGFCAMLVFLGAGCAAFQFAGVESDHPAGLTLFAMAFYTCQHCSVQLPSTKGQGRRPDPSNAAASLSSLVSA
ncbi:predicted protein [Coccidioides posadasii str. Silveira]|uniref:Predicted protein n=1 Tax=Coccidioides posadasii (strain RMSCC 757 / Silveira) TaxID=443226 RepID=E9D529_COCPS|nr:predicted protein [Coccidioides posadasii str. Silveira]